MNFVLFALSPLLFPFLLLAVARHVFGEEPEKSMTIEQK